jgi:hypothetical protein
MDEFFLVKKNIPKSIKRIETKILEINQKY